MIKVKRKSYRKDIVINFETDSNPRVLKEVTYG